jgi:transposase
LGRPAYEQLAVLVVEQAATIGRLEGEVGELRAEVADLKRRLAQNSRNSSRPPSSDGLGKPPVTKSLRRPSGRKPGGQCGHDGGHLALVAEPDEVLTHPPASCAGCGGDLSAAPVQGDERRQVFDLPEIRLRVVEHVAERRRCGCGHVTTAAFPAGVSAPTQYGPGMRALGIYLIARQHVPYQRTAELLGDWLGAPVSTGTLAAFVARGARDLEGFLDEVHRQLITAPVAHFDETGARVDGRLRWLLATSTDQLTFYALHDKRGKDGIDHAAVLPNFAGVAVHDGFKPYRHYTGARHALCNAHHLRELQAIIEQDPHHKQTWARQMDRLLRDLQLAVAAATDHGHDDLDVLQLAGYRGAYQQILATGYRENPLNTIRTGQRGCIAQTPARNLLNRLDTHREDVLRFAHDFQVPFDNNLVERDIRMVKLQQKISGCWRTSTGAEHFLALRAYLSTTRKQGRHILDALTRLAAHDPWIPQAASPNTTTTT